MITLSAVLLAGGESRRMGRDKATLEFKGRPMWMRQLELLRALQPETIFVSARSTPSWLPLGMELLLDDPPSRGPLSGLTKALADMRTTHLLALAIDMPFMSGGALRHLWSLAQPGRGVVPLIEDRAEALAAIYPAEVAADFTAALAGTDFSLQWIVRKLVAEGKVSLVPVPTTDRDFYRSLNEPGDFKEGRFLNRPI